VGAHFRNWLEQCKEIYGEQDIEIEEANPTDLSGLRKGAREYMEFEQGYERRGRKYSSLLFVGMIPLH
jgi:hypothetical protein